ncbi:hypothetical protein, partial [Ruminococcus callidus]
EKFDDASVAQSLCGIAFIIAQSGSVCQEMRQEGDLDFQESETDSATSKETEKRPLHVMSRERFLGKHCIKPAYQLCTQSACRFSVILPRNPLPDIQSACGISMQSAKKSDGASYAQALCSVSLVFLLQ